MKRIALLAITAIVILALISQLALLNFLRPEFSESKVIVLATLSEFILFIACVVLLYRNNMQQQKMANINNKNTLLHDENDEQSRLLTSLFNNANTAILKVDLDGTIISANNAFRLMLGMHDDDVNNFNLFKLIDNKDMHDMQSQIQLLIDGKININRCEQQCLKKNGEMIWTFTTMSLIRSNLGKPDYFIVQLENITTQKKAEERLQHMAYHDPLTGLANRNKLEQFVNLVIASSRRQQTGFAIMFLDLDRFKNINDSIGHDAGDMLLQIVAERLQSVVRNSDMVVRLGGDEFVLLITDVKKTESVAIISQKILENILRVISINKHELYVTTSIGISIFPNDGQNMQTLMKHADLALYRAKERGRNNYQFYTNEMTIQAQEKLVLQNTLGHALAKNEFILNYQPIMDIKSRTISGLEALLRWKNKEYGAVTPDEIVSLAEETGLIIPVSEWILHTACKQLKFWHDQGWLSLRIAVNCSSRQFKHTTFVEDILKTLSRTGLPADALEIEIREKIIMEDPENTLRVLYALKDIGVQIVIDDFGTGYWSLNNLRRLSIDKIKIDRSFIKQITTDEASASITSAILAMAKKLGIKTVAEGVETAQQYEFLAKEGCTEIQGYYLTRPLADDLMTQFLKHPIPDAEAISKTEITS